MNEYTFIAGTITTLKLKSVTITSILIYPVDTYIYVSQQS